VFVSTRSYKETLSTIYRGRFSKGALTGVKIVEGISEKAPGRVNFDVEVSADGRTLYFVDGVFSGKPTPDKADIAIAIRDDAGFRRLPGSAELLKNVNTGALEYAACVSPDELELFFTRVGKDGPAIYRSTRKNVTQPFDSPVRVASIRGFVEAPALSPDGRSLYYHLKEGERFVIYRVTRSP
jgi:Tol biopolymer transport system component